MECRRHLHELIHHRIDLFSSQHEVAHDHRLVADLLECQPGPERERRFDLDTIKQNLEISARQADAVNTAWQLRAGFAEGLGNLIFNHLRPREPKWTAQQRAPELSRRVIEDIVISLHMKCWPRPLFFLE